MWAVQVIDRALRAGLGLDFGVEAGVGAPDINGCWSVREHTCRSTGDTSVCTMGSDGR
jgi:hypothetical protein